MSDLQLYIAVGLPTIAVLTSLVVSLFQISGIRDVRGDIKTMNAKLADMDLEIAKLMDKRP
jgi:hypothetical protein